MDNYKNNKRKITNSNEIPSRKRRDENKGAENNIFNIITCDIWKIIFQFIYESVDCYRYSRGYLWVRITCKLFRELSLPYWNQELPEDKLEAYFAQENTLESVHKITVDGVLINLKRKESEIYWEGFSKACEIGFLPIIKKMIKDGADVNQVNPVNYQTPLFYASYYDQISTINLLIQNGANVKVKDICKNSILISLFPHVNLEVIKILIENGIDVTPYKCNSYEQMVLTFIKNSFKKEGLDYPKKNQF